jgi:cation transport regulator ChaC
MPATIAYDSELSQKAREYLIQLEDYLCKMNPSNHDVREVLLYLNKLITIQDSIGKVAASEKVKIKQ